MDVKISNERKSNLKGIISSFKDISDEVEIKHIDEDFSADVVQMLLDVAKLRKYQGKTWSAKQHRAAARTVKLYCQEKGACLESAKEAQKLEGIGSGIAKKIGEFLKNGKVAEVEEHLKTLNEEQKELNNLTAIWGVGDVTAKKWINLDINTIKDVRTAIERNDIKPTSQQKIGIKHYEDFQQKMTREQMKQIGQIFCNVIGKITDKYKVKICGSYRRKKLKSKDADILIYPVNNIMDGKNQINERELLEQMMEIVKENHEVDELSFGVASLFGVIEIDGIHRRFDCWVCKWSEFPFAVLAWTGSGIFNVELRKKAIKKGWKLTDKNLTDKEGNNILINGGSVRTEKHIFELLDTKYIVPSKRD